MIAALALTVVLAGCGGGASPDLSGVAQAAQKTEGAGTAQFELTVDATGLPQGGLGQTGSELKVTARGAVDYDRRQTRMTIDLGYLGRLLGAQDGSPQNLQLDPELDVVLDGKVFYMRVPLLAGVVSADKPWLKLDLEQLAKQKGADPSQLDQLSHVDPTQALAYLQGAGDFKAVGQEAVRGVETTHYTGTIDLRKAVDNAPDEQREQLEQLLKDSDLTEFPAEAWIDADGYLRKLTLNFSELPGAPGASFSIAMELFGFGEDVDIDVPPDDEATDLADLSMKGLGQG
jgi:hypothetical protein